MTAFGINDASSGSNFAAYRASSPGDATAPLEENSTQSSGADDILEQASSTQPATNLAFWRRRDTASAASRHSEPNIEHVCRLSQDPTTLRLARDYELSVVDISWDDMARSAYSCVGPNITDVSLRAKGFSRLCSIVRKPNFTDHTGDFKVGQFKVKVGNETGTSLRNQPLRDYLNNIFRKAGSSDDVIDPSHDILVAAQSCVLPVSSSRREFNIELFNYQTSAQYPACLAVVSSAKGTSAQIITERGAQPLFHNQDGRACNFFAERLQDVRQREGRPAEGPVTAEEEGRKMLLVFQIPLKIPVPPNRLYSPFLGKVTYGASTYGQPLPMMASLAVPPSPPGSLSVYAPGCGATLSAPPPPPPPSRSKAVAPPPRLRAAAPPPPPGRAAVSFRGADHAQLGITEPKGPFKGAPGRSKLELDPKAAIRCTVQHYVVTDQSSLAEAEMAEISSAIEDVYRSARAQGSLVTDADASSRATAPSNLFAQGAIPQNLWFWA